MACRERELILKAFKDLGFILSAIIISMLLPCCSVMHTSQNKVIPSEKSFGTQRNYNINLKQINYSAGFLNKPTEGLESASMALDKFDNSEVLLGFNNNSGMDTWVLNSKSFKWDLKSPLNSPPVSKNCLYSCGQYRTSNQFIAFDPSNNMIIFFDCNLDNATTWGWNGVNWIQLGNMSNSMFNDCDYNVQVKTTTSNFSSTNMFNRIRIFTYGTTVGMMATVGKYEQRSKLYLSDLSDVFILNSKSYNWSLLTVLKSYPISQVNYFPEKSEIIAIGTKDLGEDWYGFETYIFKNKSWVNIGSSATDLSDVSDVNTYLSSTGNKCNQDILFINGGIPLTLSNKSKLVFHNYLSIWNGTNWVVTKLLKTDEIGMSGSGYVIAENSNRNGVIIQTIYSPSVKATWTYTC